jgi:hypothetical protein
MAQISRLRDDDPTRLIIEEIKEESDEDSDGPKKNKNQFAFDKKSTRQNEERGDPL